MRSIMTHEFQDTFFMSAKESELRAAFLEQVELIPDGHKMKQCIQCGTCTGSCPVSFAMDITPRTAIALFRAGEIESILRSNTVWICASCYACTVRCPSGIKITDMMYAFKRIAMARKIFPKGLLVHALSSSFVSIVNKYGRNQEVSLLLKFGLKTGLAKLIANIPMGWRLRSKGRVPLRTSKIKDRKQLSGIIGRVVNMRKTVQKPSIA
jgi:heterodisulfide reductase subunit C